MKNPFVALSACLLAAAGICALGQAQGELAVTKADFSLHPG